MDANSLIGNNKQQKQDEGGEGKNKSDIKLDGLPEEIFQEIMSYLPIKEAIQTSLISKPLRDQWKGISKVELVEQYGKRQQFTDFVEKFLQVYNPSCLRKLSLICEVGEDTPKVNQWLNGFIKPTIQELKLCFERVEEPLVFPDDLFSSQKLTHFHLSMPHVINLPSFIYFRSLSTLTLRYVIFPNTSLTQQLFTSCPSLEQLTLIDCNWMKVRAVCIVCPSLEKLVIREWRDDEEDEETEQVGQNVPTYSKIVITGSKLKTFSYDGDMLNDYFLYSTSSITDGTVEVQPPPANKLHAGHFVLKLLKALSDVENLSISDFAVEALCCASFLIPYLPLFNKLLQLRVVSMAPVNLACHALQNILRRSPSLEAVDFIMGVSLPKEAVNNIGPLGTNLKTIRIYGFKGAEEEMIAIKFLLKSTPILDALCVYTNSYEFDSHAGSKRLDKLFKQIVRFPRASEDCELYFE